MSRPAALAADRLAERPGQGQRRVSRTAAQGRRRRLAPVGLAVLATTLWLGNTVLWTFAGYGLRLPPVWLLLVAAIGHAILCWLWARIDLPFHYLAVVSVFVGPWVLFSAIGVWILASSLATGRPATGLPPLVALIASVGAAALGYLAQRRSRVG